MILPIIQKALHKNATAENKQNYERYFKGVIKFYGLKSDGVKSVFKTFWPEIKKLKLEKQIELAFNLLSSKYAEEKQLGIKILNKNKQLLPLVIIHDLEKLIDKHVYDWATCDTLSGGVIRYLIERDEKTIKTILKWKNSRCLWRQRAAAISFVNLARHGKYNSEIIEICATIIQNPERFVQLGTGWVLRELSLADLNLTTDFIKNNYRYFSRESLRYAIEKMEPGLKQKLLNYS